MADPTAGLDHDQVEPERQVRQWRPIREDATLEQAVCRRSNPRPFPMIDRLLGQAEVPPGPPADLDRDERPRWAGVDGHQVELVAADVDVPAQDRPTGRQQPVRDEVLGAVARTLRIRSHRRTVRARDCLALTR
jgi:hypothetical protein